MAGELIDFANRIDKIVDPAALKRITLAAGMAGKTASLGAAAADLGADRAFSGLGRKVSLSAGFDVVTPTLIKMNFRPPGLWILADTGRRGGKTIVPRRKLGGEGSVHAPALRLPDGGYRRSSTTGAWGGKGTLKSAVRATRIAVPRAAFRQFQIEVAKVVR